MTSEKIDRRKNNPGRPRSTDRQGLFDRLLAWSKLDTSISLNAFCAEFEEDPEEIIRFTHEDKIFSKMYRQVKTSLGNRREQMLNAGLLHQRAYDRSAHVYDQFAKIEARSDLDYAHE